MGKRKGVKRVRDEDEDDMIDIPRQGSSPVSRRKTPPECIESSGKSRGAMATYIFHMLLKDLDIMLPCIMAP